MDFEYVLLGLIILLGAVGARFLVETRREIQKLKSIVFGVDKNGYPSRRGSLHSQINDLKRSNLEGNLNTLGDIISPLIEAQHKKDIELVLKADYPNSKGFDLDFREGEFKVFINNYHDDIFVGPNYRSSIDARDLSNILRRAAEINAIKDRLGCKKPQAKKASKKVKSNKKAK